MTPFSNSADRGTAYDQMAESRPIFIITGLSGAGKTTALRAFEDLNYFTVDGLPASLTEDIATMMHKPAMHRFSGLAIGMDMRESNFLEEFKKVTSKTAALKASLIFLEAADNELLKRYAATRRPHPLEKQGIGLAGAIALERSQLNMVKDKADLVIDSSGFSIHDLRREIHQRFSHRNKSAHILRVNVLSFGYKYGLPEDADFIFDLRFLDNPYFVDSLRPLSGQDQSVAEYVFRSGIASEFLSRLLNLLRFVLRQMEDEGRSRVTIALGCTGGMHRSVAVAIRLAHELSQSGYPVSIEHRNLKTREV